MPHKFTVITNIRYKRKIIEMPIFFELHLLNPWAHTNSLAYTLNVTLGEQQQQ